MQSVQRRGSLPVDSTLLAEIIRQSETTPSERGNNVGGWRSGTRLSRWPSAHATLTALLELVVEARALDAWAVVHRDGSYHDWHRHSGRPWACVGVFYLTSGAPTIFRVNDHDVTIEPIAGDVITFSADLDHRTALHDSTEPRVTVAFNAYARR